METVQSDPRSRELGLWVPGGKEAAQPDPARLCDPAWLSGVPVTLSEPQSPHVRGVEAHRADVVGIGSPSAGPRTAESSDPAPGLRGRAGAPAPSDLTQSRPWGRGWLTWTGGAAQHRDVAPRAPWLRADAFNTEQRTRLVPNLSCLSVAVVAESREGPWAGPLIQGSPTWRWHPWSSLPAALTSPRSPQLPDADASWPSWHFLNLHCVLSGARGNALFITVHILFPRNLAFLNFTQTETCMVSGGETSSRDRAGGSGLGGSVWGPSTLSGAGGRGPCGAAGHLEFGEKAREGRHGSV